MRVANRPLAFILAAALLTGSVVIIAEVIGFAVHRSPLLVHWTTWQTGPGQPAGTLRGPGLGHGPDGRRARALGSGVQAPPRYPPATQRSGQATDAT